MRILITNDQDKNCIFKFLQLFYYKQYPRLIAKDSSENQQVKFQKIEFYNKLYKQVKPSVVLKCLHKTNNTNHSYQLIKISDDLPRHRRKSDNEGLISQKILNIDIKYPRTIIQQHQFLDRVKDLRRRAVQGRMKTKFQKSFKKIDIIKIRFIIFNFIQIINEIFQYNKFKPIQSLKSFQLQQGFSLYQHVGYQSFKNFYQGSHLLLTTIGKKILTFLTFVLFFINIDNSFLEEKLQQNQKNIYKIKISDSPSEPSIQLQQTRKHIIFAPKQKQYVLLQLNKYKHKPYEQIKRDSIIKFLSETKETLINTAPQTAPLFQHRLKPYFANQKKVNLKKSSFTSSSQRVKTIM